MTNLWPFLTCFGHWILKFGISLEFGAWDLRFLKFSIPGILFLRITITLSTVPLSFIREVESKKKNNP
jgi:hypothetical protein